MTESESSKVEHSGTVDGGLGTDTLDISNLGLLIFLASWLKSKISTTGQPR